MARHEEGWKLKQDKRSGIYSVRFRHKSARNGRYDVSTGTRDPSEATEHAKRIYAEIVSGRYRYGLIKSPARPGQPLDEVAALWLDAKASTLDPKTIRTYETIYVKRHWQPFFVSLDALIEPRIDAYREKRLSKVKAKTVKKELSALRGFLAWAHTNGHLADLPLVKSPGKSVTGTSDTSRPHKAGPVELSEEEVARFLKALPLWSAGKGKRRRFRVREAMEVSYETGLRAESIRLIVGADFKGGKLRLRGEADKARWSRTLPLSARARAIFESIGAKDLEPFFGSHDYRAYIDPACVAAKIPRISPHDLRHARGSHLVDRTADLRGAAFLLGHKEITTMNKYAKPTERAAERALRTEKKRGAR